MGAALRWKDCVALGLTHSTAGSWQGAEMETGLRSQCPGWFWVVWRGAHLETPHPVDLCSLELRNSKQLLAQVRCIAHFHSLFVFNR